MLFSAASLLVIGIVFVFEADNLPISFGIKGVKQIIWAFFGVATTLLFTLIDYKKLADEKSLKRLMIILGILLFILAFCSILYLFGHDVKLGTYGL
jgi:cell division protein FtsW (lipid II flippase)